MRHIGALISLSVGLSSVLTGAGALSLRATGIENCHNKCDKVFDRTQYAISDQPGESTFEYRSCLIGCARCDTDLARDATRSQCFQFCKNYDYGRNGIRKGVIEPDKGCIMGCLINTCQEVCTGGTTDFSVTPQNQHLWWAEPGSMGCSIKSGLGYVQNPDYGNPDAGEGASNQQRLCCAQAFNMCYYEGDRASTNFANVVIVTQRQCAAFVPSAPGGGSNLEAICAYYNDARNCGQQGMTVTPNLVRVVV